MVFDATTRRFAPQVADALSELWTEKPLSNRSPMIMMVEVDKQWGDAGSLIEATLNACDPEVTPCEQIGCCSAILANIGSGEGKKKNLRL